MRRSATIDAGPNASKARSTRASSQVAPNPAPIRRTVSPNVAATSVTRAPAILKQSPMSLVAAGRNVRDNFLATSQPHVPQAPRYIPPPPSAKGLEGSDERVYRLIRAGGVSTQHIERHSDPHTEEVKQTLSSRSRAAFSQKRALLQAKQDTDRKRSADVKGPGSLLPPTVPTARSTKRSASPWGPTSTALPNALRSNVPLLSSKQMSESQQRLSANAPASSRNSSASRPPATSRKIVASESTVAAIKNAVSQRLREAAMNGYRGATAPKQQASAATLSKGTSKELPSSRNLESFRQITRPVRSAAPHPSSSVAPKCPPPPYHVRITKVAVFAAVDTSVARVRNTVSPPRGKHEQD